MMMMMVAPSSFPPCTISHVMFITILATRQGDAIKRTSHFKVALITSHKSNVTLSVQFQGGQRFINSWPEEYSEL